MDGKAVKAYYRRMQAREQMPNGDLKLALSDCKIVLQIEPKNGDAQRGLCRLQQSAPATTAAPTPTKREHSTDEGIVPTQALWSQYDGNSGYERIDFIAKAPHLQSTEPLKRIALGNDEQKITALPVTVNPQPKDVGSKTTAAAPTTTATKSTAPPHIDQTNATVKPVVNKHKPSPPSHSTDLVIPKNAAQFYRVWSSLSDDSRKFTVLKVCHEQFVETPVIFFVLFFPSKFIVVVFNFVNALKTIY